MDLSRPSVCAYGAIVVSVLPVLAVRALGWQVVVALSARDLGSNVSVWATTRPTGHVCAALPATAAAACRPGAGSAQRAPAHAPAPRTGRPAWGRVGTGRPLAGVRGGRAGSGGRTWRVRGPRRTGAGGPDTRGSGRHRGAPLIRAAAVSPSLSGAGPAPTIGRSSRTAPSTGCSFLASAVCGDRFFLACTTCSPQWAPGISLRCSYRPAALVLLVWHHHPKTLLEQQIQLLSCRNFAIGTNKYFCATRNTGFFMLLKKGDFFIVKKGESEGGASRAVVCRGLGGASHT
jgi:hypothetical protein